VSCGRLSKEQKLYAKENLDQKLKVDRFVASNADEWDIKNGKRMLEESERMIVDTHKRLGDAVQGLRGLIIEFKADPVLAEAQELAQELLSAEEEIKTATL